MYGSGVLTGVGSAASAECTGKHDKLWGSGDDRPRTRASAKTPSISHTLVGPDGQRLDWYIQTRYVHGEELARNSASCHTHTRLPYREGGGERKRSPLSKAMYGAMTAETTLF
ncbi:hypothetical protein BKA62DRAFT_673768 [Auriculariales sp. MPI-PUGE-AT-0066]|nr:hypothetical protein BKA62DRAFT_673768 [Auriculariales sp. MPI-PUGE-AT-0066]